MAYLKLADFVRLVASAIYSCLKKSILIFGYLAVLIGVFVVNISFGNFHLGFENQPIAHTDGLWNFLGMALAGFCSVLLGGCPLRQFDHDW